MINNRQNGRRRGRGGPQVRNGAGGGADRGNRIDNRARGNAAQLHEKYRNLARDAQTQGDRVMTEYYLQFADHYFRVLSESRARFEEQQPRRGRDEEYDDGGDDGEIYADDRVGQPHRQDRFERNERQEQRPEMHGDRQEYRGEREQPRYEQPRYEQRAERQSAEPNAYPDEDRADSEGLPAREPEAVALSADDGEPRRPRRGRRPRRDNEAEAVQAERIEVDRLPPAFVQEPSTAPEGGSQAAEGEEAPRRRRARRAKGDGDSVAA